MNKISSVLINVFFAFFIVFFIASCARKAPAPQNISLQEEDINETGVEMQNIGNETIGAAKEAKLKAKEDPKESEDFPEVPDNPVLNRKFEMAPFLEPIYFGFDNHVIQPEDRRTLNKHASWFINNPNVFVKIEGHCDERGTLDYNLALGDRRATSTKKYLISLGLDPSKIVAISYGEERPTCDAKNELCWSRNRRAEFFISKNS